MSDKEYCYPLPNELLYVIGKMINDRWEQRVAELQSQLENVKITVEEQSKVIKQQERKINELKTRASVGIGRKCFAYDNDNEPYYSFFRMGNYRYDDYES